jgi:hypothetical protein
LLKAVRFGSKWLLPFLPIVAFEQQYLRWNLVAYRRLTSFRA